MTHSNYYPDTREEQGGRTDEALRQDEELWERLMGYLQTRTLLLCENQLYGTERECVAVCNALRTFRELGVTRVYIVAEVEASCYASNSDPEFSEVAEWVAELVWEGATSQKINEQIDEWIVNEVDRDAEPVFAVDEE